MTAVGIAKTRAAAVLGTYSADIRWPYGMRGVDQGLRRTDPAGYERACDELRARQKIMVEWAEKNGLNQAGESVSGCCPKWLLRNASRLCPAAECCRYGYSLGVDHSWMDHPVYWIRDRRPAAITSAPYDLNGDDRERIRWWTEQHPILLAAYGTGWYGHGATQVVLWRPDRIEDLAAT